MKLIDKLVKEFTSINEARGRIITLSWDMGDPNKYIGDWQDLGIYLDSIGKGEITVSGTEKDLYNWLVNEYGLPKKDAHLEIMRGKKVKL